MVKRWTKSQQRHIFKFGGCTLIFIFIRSWVGFRVLRKICFRIHVWSYSILIPYSSYPYLFPYTVNIKTNIIWALSVHIHSVFISNRDKSNLLSRYTNLYGGCKLVHQFANFALRYNNLVGPYKGLFSFQIKIFHPVISNIWHKHRVLNIEKKLITRIACKLRDEAFKPNCSMIWQCGATINIC